MSKTKAIIQQILEDNTQSRLKIARKTSFISQSDGSVLRRIVDGDGTVISEETMTAQQCFSLDVRSNLGMTQKNFAELLGVPVRTLHDWEQGRREPSGAAKTLLKIASRHPEVLREVLEDSFA